MENTAAKPTVDISQLLSFSVKNNASDLHLSADVPPMIRVDGDVKRINMPALSHKEVHSMIYDIMNDKQRKDYRRIPGNRFFVRNSETGAFSVSMRLTRTAEPPLFFERFPPRF